MRGATMRNSLFACLAVVLVLAGGLIALLGPRHCPVNRAAFERVENGMTRAEVHAILGGPPGDYRTQPPGIILHEWGGGWSMSKGCGDAEEWEGDEGTVKVQYHHIHGKVMAVDFQDATPHAAGVVELARWRLRKLEEALLL
jgi:hypothetical protein